MSSPTTMPGSSDWMRIEAPMAAALSWRSCGTVVSGMFPVCGEPTRPWQSNREPRTFGCFKSLLKVVQKGYSKTIALISPFETQQVLTLEPVVSVPEGLRKCGVQPDEKIERNNSKALFQNVWVKKQAIGERSVTVAGAPSLATRGIWRAPKFLAIGGAHYSLCATTLTDICIAIP